MSPREHFALRHYLSPELKGRTLSDARLVVSLTNILEQTCLVGRPGDLAGRSVLLAVSDQLISGVAMTEIDGVARRMLLCPPDLNTDHLQALIEDAEIDAIVTDQPARWADAGVYLVMAARAPVRGAAKLNAERATEWLMLTSGTSGVPKIVGHTLERVEIEMNRGDSQGARVVIHPYGREEVGEDGAWGGTSHSGDQGRS